MKEKMQIGVIGCGNISDAYFNAAKTFKMMEYTWCADQNPEAAKAKAEKYGCQATTVEELLRIREVDAILNLTTPQSHAQIDMMALQAGKHVYAEKPFSLTLEEARPILALAEQKKLRVGSAPDTFLGGGIQTCRKLIDDGWIGQPLSGTAFMMCPGHESWHPNPAFYYLRGGGPLFDMGPYYLTALVNLLGPVAKVTAMGSKGHRQRVCTSESRFGDVLPVEVDTHLAGTLQFASGAIITLIMSFDIVKNSCPCLEIHGSAGSLSCPDPNTFGGPVRYSSFDGRKNDWQEIPIPFGYIQNSRSIGLADMVEAIRTGRQHRCNDRLAFHVLEVMCGLEKSAASEQAVTIESTCERPEPLTLGLLNGKLQ